MVEERPSGAEKEHRRGDLSPNRGGRGRAAASILIRSEPLSVYVCIRAL